MSAVPNEQTKLRIIRGTDPVPVLHPIFLLFGQPGLGKSSLGFSAKNPILLNFDSESALARAVNRRDAINVLTREAMEQLEENPALLDGFDTIIVDTVGRCVDVMAASIIYKTPKYGRDGSLTLQGYGVLKSRFRTWMTALRAMGKTIVLIAHHREEKNGDATFVRPDITGGSKDEVLRLSDFVAFLYMKGKTRILDFNPTEEWFGKNPAQWEPFQVPSPEKATDFLGRLVALGCEYLSKTSEASANVANTVIDWKATIADYKTVEEFSNAIPELLKLPQSAQLQIAPTLMAAAEAKGFKYDKPAKKFVVLTPEPAGAL